MRLFEFNSRSHSQSIEKIKERTSPWNLGGLSARELAKRAYRAIDQDEVFTRAAALAYYFFAALIPMVVFLMAMLGIFAHQSGQLRASLLEYAARVMPGDAFTLVEKTLKELSSNSTGLKLIFGLAAALWAGSGGISSIMDALNRCYHVNDSRPYWKRKLISVGLALSLSVLIVSSLVIVLYGGDIAQAVGNHLGLSNVTVALWKIAQWPVALFFVVLAFALLYFWGPDAKQEWQWITPGSLLGVTIWIGASVLFRVYLHFFNSYSKSYGSMGAVIVLLLWLYISGLALLIGAEINSEIENAAAKRGHPEAKEAGEKAA
jgi:membrane protein